MTSLRDRRRQQTTHEIETAALNLLAERTFDEVSVDDIAKAAGVSKRTFFRYFASKDDVILGYDRWVHGKFLKLLRERPLDEDASKALRNSLLSASRLTPGELEVVLTRAHVLTNAPLLHARSRGERIAHNADVVKALQGREQQRVTDGHTAPSDDFEERARTITFAMLAVASGEWDAWFASDRITSPTDHITKALDLLEAGLSHTSARNQGT